MKLATRITLLSIALVGCTVVVLATWLRHEAEGVLRPVALYNLSRHGRLLASDLDGQVGAARAEVLAIRDSPGLRELIRAERAGDADAATMWREHLERRFVADVRQWPSVRQLRYLRAEPVGHEVVRVHRGPGGEPVVQPEAQMQDKSRRDYYERAMALAPGEVHMSSIDLNVEHGAVEIPHQPTLRIAAPVEGDDGTRAGVVVLNLDMGLLFRRLSPASDDHRLFVVNGEGDYLVHPDADKAFGFQLGEQHLLKTDLPEAAARLDESTSFFTNTAAGQAVAVTTIPSQLDGGPRWTLVETVPRHVLLSVLEPVRRLSLTVGGAAMVVGLVLSVLVARSLTRPLAQLTEAARALRRGRKPVIATETEGEIGELASAFRQMSDTLEERDVELRRQERRFRRVVETAPVAMLVFDDDGTITLANHKAEALFGFGHDELVGERVDGLLPDRANAHGGEEPRELHASCKDGRSVPIEMAMTPLEDVGGTSTLASIIDVSERKRREDELRRSNDELEQFAYVASHDLQEPLRMVTSYLSLLGERYSGKLDDQADTYIHFAVDGARHMKSLVDDLLAYSRVGSDSRPFAVVDLDRVVDVVLEAMSVTVQETGATIERDHLPEVLGDEVQLRQLFQNLIGNAIKFRSQKAPHIIISANRTETHWAIDVSDNGIGLDMKFANRIFQMFQRLHSRHVHPGSGIGLAIAKRIVERHEGRIAVDSEPGRGTTFSITLKAVDA